MAETIVADQSWLENENSRFDESSVSDDAVPHRREPDAHTNYLIDLLKSVPAVACAACERVSILLTATEMSMPISVDAAEARLRGTTDRFAKTSIESAVCSCRRH